MCIRDSAKPLYYTMFTTQSLEISAQVLRWYSIEAFLSTIAPIFTSLMMAVGLRYRALKYVGLHFIIKMVLTMPLLIWIGYPGTIISDIIAYGTMILFDAYELKKQVNVRWKYTIRRFFCCLLYTSRSIRQWISLQCLCQQELHPASAKPENGSRAALFRSTGNV